MPAIPLESIASLFDSHGALVYRRCKQLLRDEEQAKDAVQEVFLRVMARQESFRGECLPTTWLYRIATTYCLQRLRNSNRHRAKLQLLAAAKPPDQPFAPENKLTLTRLILELDATAQLIAFYRFMDGMTLEEVAEASGLSRKTVAKQLKRIERRAHHLLGEDLQEEVAS